MSQAVIVPNAYHCLTGGILRNLFANLDGTVSAQWMIVPAILLRAVDYLRAKRTRVTRTAQYERSVCPLVPAAIRVNCNDFCVYYRKQLAAPIQEIGRVI